MPKSRTKDDLKKLLALFTQLAEESADACSTTEGNYLTRYYVGTHHTALTVIEMLNSLLSGDQIPDQLPIIDK